MGSELTVAEALLAGRTTRSFDPDRPVEPETLVRILELAAMSPSDSNLQPWRFLVVRDRRNLEKLGRCVPGGIRIDGAPVVVLVLAYHHPDRTHLDRILGEMVDRGILGPSAAAAFRGRTASSMARVPDPALWAARLGMLAAMAIILASESLGVQSALIERWTAEPIRQAFGIPDDHAICCLIGLGHARDLSPFPGRLTLDEICFSEHFGQPFAGRPEQRSP